MKAVTVADAANAMLPVFKRKVAAALDLIRSDEIIGRRVGVSFSTGKDSTVTLDLVRQVIPDVPAAYFHSGDETEYDENKRLIAEHYPFVEVLDTEQTMADLCRNYGHLGHSAEIVPRDVKWAAFLVGEPSMRFVIEHDLNVTALGLRGQESVGRRMNHRRRGKLYRLRPEYYNGREHWHLLPVADWTDGDVWAYIASRELAYNPIYDKMASVGIPRRQWRVSVLLGASASNLGRYSFLRMVAPEKYNRLAALFPEVRRSL